jgi:branched-chain amino acid transport system permease protein
MREHYRTVLWIAFAVIALPLAFSSPYYGGIAISACVFALLALSVDLVFGRLGYISFGHAAFFGLGAYAAALLNTVGGVNFWLAAVLAAVPSAILGALVGFASLRVGGAYFAIASLTTAEILHLIAANWMPVTRGPLGILVPAPGVPFLAVLGLTDRQSHLVIVMAVAAVLYAAVARLMTSPLGRSWLAVRESLDLAESIGIPTLEARVINLALSGGIAAIAGALFIPKILVASPELLSPTYSAMGLLMVILGGKGTLIGPLIGGIIFALLPEALRVLDEYRLAIFAILILVMIRVKPEGIVALVRQWLEKPRLASVPASSSAAMVPAAHPDAPRPVAGAGAQPLLEVGGASKAFVGVRAVNQVTFSVAAEEIVGLIGPNGAGKTTLLNLISGFLAVDAGRIAFAGNDLSGLPPHRNAALGLVRTFQHAELYRHLTAVENVMVGTHLRQRSSLAGSLLRTAAFREAEAARRKIALRALALVGLEQRAEIVAQDLPYGEQRLLAIALALAAQPRMLLLDEPAAGLNQTEAVRLAELLSRLRAEGLTIVLVEHNLDLVMSVCDRIVVLHHGEVATIGTPADVRQNETVRSAYLGLPAEGDQERQDA